MDERIFSDINSHNYSSFMSTLFSKIIAGEIPSYKIYEDEYVYAFLDIFPHVLGHTLIVPKIEIDHFSEVPEPYYSAIFLAAKEISPAITKATGCARICSMFVGYEIPHCHYHLIPTNSMDDIAPEKSHPADASELESMQKAIVQYLPS